MNTQKAHRIARQVRPGSPPVTRFSRPDGQMGALWGNYGFGAGSLPSRIIISYLACTYRPTGEDRHRVHHSLPLWVSMALRTVARSWFICSTLPRSHRMYSTGSVSGVNTGGLIGSVTSLDRTSGTLSYFTTSLVQEVSVSRANSDTSTGSLVLLNGIISLIL